MSYEGEGFEVDMETLAKLAGWRVLGARKFNEDDGSSVAPSFDGENNRTITPDLWLMKDGDTRWVECKEKEDYFTYRKEDIDQHGIDAHCWHDYRTAQKQTGDTVWIFVYERSSSILFGKQLDGIEVTGNYSFDNYQSNAAKYENEMVFFRRGSLERVPVPEHIASDTRLNKSYQSDISQPSGEFVLFPDQPNDDEGQSGLNEFADGDD